MSDLLRMPASWIDQVHRIGRMVRRDVVHATPVQLRQAIEVASRLNPGPWGGEVRGWDVPHCEGIEVTWKGKSEGTVVWVHGGAFAFGSPRVYQAAAIHLARNTGCRVLLPHYRLAPEHVYPAAHEDVLKALLEIHACYGKVVVVGDSAGGNLVLGAFRKEQTTSFSPRDVLGVALLSPWCDLRDEAKSIRANEVKNSPFDHHDSLEYSRRYLGTHPASDPHVSPLAATDFEGLPPVYLEWAEDEFLAPDVVELGERMTRDGVEVHRRVEPTAVHGWQLLPDFLPEASRSSRMLGQWIRNRFQMSSLKH